MPNPLNELGEKIFLDRYSLKDMTKETLQVGDTVLVCVNQKTRQREIGVVTDMSDKFQPVTIKLRDGSEVVQSWDDVDKPLELNAEETMARAAKGLAAIETTPEKQAEWEENFKWLLDDWRFVPGGRILAAAGTDQKLTYFNCYVIPSPKDSRHGIIHTLLEMTEIMSRGGGVGINLSTLRPQHAYVKGVNGRSSGSVSWGGLYSFATGLIEQGGSRRGALMLILNDWHPDVIDFINAKREAGKITNANISVGVSNAFMEAVDNDGDWNLEFPDASHPAYETHWTGDLRDWKKSGYPVNVYKTIKARELWSKLIESAWSSAEPGVFFIDHANDMSNSHYYNRLVATNPCGEQPLPPYSVCLLGAINLSRFVVDGKIDAKNLEKTVAYAVRFMDNVIEATPYFLAENEAQQKGERRIGLGIMGLAEMLVRLKVAYGSKQGNATIEKIGKIMADAAYNASADLAKEKGAFTYYKPEFLESGFVKQLPDSIKDKIAKHGIRNVTLLTVAPTGTTGTMVGTSTGIEPYYSWSYFRASRLGIHEEIVPIAKNWMDANPGKELPDYFVSAMDLTPEEHVGAQAAMQKYVDSAISKTCNAPNDYTVEQTKALYESLFKLGCKGGTIYRDGCRDTQVLSLKKEDAKQDPDDKIIEVEKPKKDVSPLRDRPNMTSGFTIEKNSPLGHVFTTLNMSDDGEPFELFINAGKTGSDVSSMTEALGRAVSLLLRIEASMSPAERLSMLVDQFEGISGSNPVGFGKNKVKSLPEAVAKGIEEILARQMLSKSPKNTDIVLAAMAKQDVQEKVAETPKTGVKGKKKPKPDLCPQCGEATFIREEGCQHCTSCNHSRCG